MPFNRPPASTPAAAAAVADVAEEKHEFTDSDSSPESPQLPKEAPLAAAGLGRQKSGKGKTMSSNLAEEKPSRASSAFRLVVRERAALHKEQAEFALEKAEFEASVDGIMQELDELKVAREQELEAARELKQGLLLQLEAARAEKKAVEEAAAELEAFRAEKKAVEEAAAELEAFRAEKKAVEKQMGEVRKRDMEVKVVVRSLLGTMKDFIEHGFPEEDDEEA